MNSILRLICSLFITIVLCQVIFVIIKSGLNKFNNHKQERLAEILLGNTDYDVLFIGSSRTHTSINPEIIDSVTALNTYNAGAEGGNIFEFKLLLDAYLESHPAPRSVVLTIDLHSFDLKRKLFNYTQYYPFIDNRFVEEALATNGNNPKLLKVLPFLELAEYDDYTRSNAVKGLLGKTEIPSGEEQYKGYLTNSTDFTTEDVDSSTNKVRLKVDPEGFLLLEKIIETCSKENINLILTYAPEYKRGLQKNALNSKQILGAISEIANENRLPYLRHDQLVICRDNKLFANLGHLNRIGADIYSGIIGEELRDLLNKERVVIGREVSLLRDGQDLKSVFN